jgi:hypothetical protein
MCDNSEMVSCEICGRDFGDLNKLSKHFRVHKISSKDYYDKYLKKDGEGICALEGCSKQAKFSNITKGYSRGCCQSHSSKTKILETITCEICKREFNGNGALTSHINGQKGRGSHPKTIEEYREIYCPKVEEDLKIKCQICSKRFKNFRALGHHLSHNKKDHPNSKEYYDMFIREEGEGTCHLKNCNEETYFQGFELKYLKYCSKEHADMCFEVRKKRSEGNIKARKDPNSGHNSEEYIEKIRKATQARWDDPDDFLNSQELKDIRSKYMKEIWDDPDGVFNTPEYRKLKSDIMKKLWEDPDCIWRSEAWLNDVVPKRSKNIKSIMKKVFEENGEEIYKKSLDTWIKKYGDHPMRVQEFKDKFNKTCLENFGGHPMKNDRIKDKCKETCLDRYNVENYSQTKECKNRIEKTNMEKFGFSCSLQNEEVKEKARKTSLELHGVEYYTQTEEFKESQSRRMLNGGAAHALSFMKNPSKPQVELFQLVQQYCPYVILNYPCLNFSIDIAIPKLGIAIEYDGSYWHQDKEADNRRQKLLEDEGWKFLRYRDYVPRLEEFKKDIDNILKGD